MVVQHLGCQLEVLGINPAVSMGAVDEVEVSEVDERAVEVDEDGHWFHAPHRRRHRVPDPPVTIALTSSFP
ncbi:hypothetical protein ACWDRR_33135 [Kitasatospora sp. NPDC003701]